MFTIMIPRTAKVGDTVDVRINFKPARLTWESEDVLIINGTDRRQIFQRHDDVDGRGVPCHFFIAGDSQADIASGKADSVTITTPDETFTYRHK